MTSTNSNAMLTSLTLVALAIPGIAQAEQGTGTQTKESTVNEQYLRNLNGDAPTPTSPGKSTNSWIPNVTNDVKFTHYKEGGSKKPRENTNRYTIDVWQAHVVVPVKDYIFTLNAQRDSQSGASAYFNALLGTDFPGSANPYTITDAVASAASIQSDRNEVDFQVSYNGQESQYGAKAYYSSEEDNQSPGLSLSGQWDFNKHNTILTAEAGVGWSRNTPVGEGEAAHTAFPRLKGSSTIQKYYVAVKQDLSKYNYMQLSTELDVLNGDLADPYRLVLIYGNAATLSTPPVFLPPFFFTPGLIPAGVTVTREKRPNNRSIVMPLLRFVQAVPQTGGAVHLDYRYGADNWGIHSHAFEAVLYQPFMDGWEITPKIRYYSQSRAKFYAPIFSVAGPFPTNPYPLPQLNNSAYSSDYRLSDYGTMNYEAKLSYQALSMLNVGVTVGYYLRKASYKLGSKSPWQIPETKGNGRGAKYFSAELRMKL
jgi:hypothetical protein